MQEIPRFARDDRRFAALGMTSGACHPKTRRAEGSAYRLDHLGNKPAQERGSHIQKKRKGLARYACVRRTG